MPSTSNMMSFTLVELHENVALSPNMTVRLEGSTPIRERIGHLSQLVCDLNDYCPECPPRGTIGHLGGQQKKFLPFGHGRDLVAFNGTGL